MKTECVHPSRSIWQVDSQTPREVCDEEVGVDFTAVQSSQPQHTLVHIKPSSETVARFSPGHLLREIVDYLTDHAELAGVLIDVEPGSAVGISRRTILQKLSQMYFKDLYIDQPIAKLLASGESQMLQLPQNTSISEAINQAMHRPTEARYEPVVVIDEQGESYLLDLNQLLMAQCDALCETLSALERQTVARQAAESDRLAMQQRLVTASRQAGMAEIATNILHNVGNVLNSVNVSSQVVVDRLRDSKISSLGKAVDLLKQNENNLSEFLATNSRGQQLLAYFEQLAHYLTEEQHTLIDEMDSISRSIEHINHVISAQQDYATGALTIEAIDLAGLLDDAVKMNAISFDRHHIQVTREYETAPAVHADKHMIMQIIVNLLTNARAAMRHQPSDSKTITLKVHPCTLEQTPAVRVEIQDTGEGISAENLSKIFQQGFTTRKDGHGFGLHNAANAAKQMGGSLTATSNGPGAGACFALTLPIEHR